MDTCVCVSVGPQAPSQEVSWVVIPLNKMRHLDVDTVEDFVDLPPHSVVGEDFGHTLQYF